MTKAPLLRRWLAENGYGLCREIPAQEEQRLYTVMQAQYTGEKRNISPLEARIGALDQRDPVARAYVQAQTDALEKKAAGLTRAGLDARSEEALAAALTAWAQGKEQEHAG